MRRELLLNVLTRVSPALSSDDLGPPIFTHLCFSGKRVFAYNARIMISAPLETHFKGALPGKVLMNLLDKSRAKDVEFVDRKTKDSPSVLIKAAKTRMNLPILTEDKFSFVMPDPSTTKKQIKSTAFIEAIRSCMRSVGYDMTMPDQLGITLLSDGEFLDLYSTNNSTISTARIKVPLNLDQRVVLSEPFCKQMLELHGNAIKDDAQTNGFQLDIHDKHVLFTDDKQGTHLLYGSLIEIAKPLNFKSIIEEHTPKGYKKHLIDLRPIDPKTEKESQALERVLDRATVITDHTDHKSMTITVSEPGKMKFLSQSKYGEVEDTLAIPTNHPPVSTRVEPRLMKLGSKFFDKWFVTDRVVLMEKGDMKYLIGTTGT